MRLLVHIGIPKTGTTSIQKFFDSNRKALNEYGYHYLSSMGRRSHEPFPRCFFGPGRLKDDYFIKKGIRTEAGVLQHKVQKLAELDAELSALSSSTHTVITSCEHFYSRLKSEAEIGSFGEVVRAYFSQVKIVCYLREQVDLTTSLYSTNLKSGGGGRTLREFVGKHCRPSNDYYNYYNSLARWVSIFGKNNMMIRIFDKSEFVDGDLVKDFAANVLPEVAGKLDTSVSVENESINHLAQVLARYVNKRIKRFPSSGVNPVNEALISLLSEAFKGKGECLSEEEVVAIRKNFEDSNRRLLEEYFPGRNRLFNVDKKLSDSRILSARQEEALEEFLDKLIEASSHKVVVENHHIAVIRGCAETLAQQDVKKAYALMKVAEAFRPNGPLVRKQLAEYKEMLGADD